MTDATANDWGNSMIQCRRTVVAHGRMAIRELRLNAAREQLQGLQILTFEHLAARMAGGMYRPVDDEELRRAVQQSLPATELGELDAIKVLPGMISASVDTLRKAWRADINLQERAGYHPRIRAVAQLEAAVLEALPSTMKRPGDLAAAALERLDHAPVILGPIDILGITELSPCWRSLLHGLASRIPVRWIAGPSTVPPWLSREVVEVVEDEPQAPEVVAVRAATAYHEAIESLRWARELVSSGTAKPAEIAIASVWPAEFDDHLLALRRDANIGLHFVHGVERSPPHGKDKRPRSSLTLCGKVRRRAGCDDSTRWSRSIPVPSKRSRRAGSVLSPPMHRSPLGRRGSGCSVGWAPPTGPTETTMGPNFSTS